ncbi:hypothetical protein VJW53_07160, partial [Escherichia coli]
RGCNPTSSKFIHTWLRFGEIMRGSLRAARGMVMGKNDVNQIADNVRVVHAGCGVNALSGLQSHANSIY